MTLDDLWRALALMVVLEGLLYALFPHQIRALMARSLAQPPEMLRLGGLVLASCGLMVAWLLVR